MLRSLPLASQALQALAKRMSTRGVQALAELATARNNLGNEAGDAALARAESHLQAQAQVRCPTKRKASNLPCRWLTRKFTIQWLRLSEFMVQRSRGPASTAQANKRITRLSSWICSMHNGCNTGAVLTSSVYSHRQLLCRCSWRKRRRISTMMAKQADSACAPSSRVTSSAVLKGSYRVAGTPSHI